MARVYTQKTRKERTCSKCGDTIHKGEQYRCASPGFRAPQIDRCMKNECSFRQSELVTSNMQSAYAGVEDAEDSIPEAESLDDIKTALSDAVAGIEESRDMYQEATDNWAGGERTNEEWDSIIDQLQECIDMIEDWEPDQDPDEMEVDEDADEEAQAEFEENKEDAMTEARDSALSMLGDLPWP